MSFDHNKLLQTIQDQTKKQKKERDQWETNDFWSLFKNKSSRIYLEKILKLTDCFANNAEELDENERYESILTLTYVIISKYNSLHNTLKKCIIREAKKEKIIPDNADFEKELKKELMEICRKQVKESQIGHKKQKELTNKTLNSSPGMFNIYGFPEDFNNILKLSQTSSYQKIQMQVVKESFAEDRLVNEKFSAMTLKYIELVDSDITVDKFNPEDALGITDKKIMKEASEHFKK